MFRAKDNCSSDLAGRPLSNRYTGITFVKLQGNLNTNQQSTVVCIKVYMVRMRFQLMLAFSVFIFFIAKSGLFVQFSIADILLHRLDIGEDQSLYPIHLG